MAATTEIFAWLIFGLCPPGIHRLRTSQAGLVAWIASGGRLGASIAEVSTWLVFKKSPFRTHHHLTPVARGIGCIAPRCLIIAALANVSTRISFVDKLSVRRLVALIAYADTGVRSVT